MLTWAQIAIGILHSGIAHERQPNFRQGKKENRKIERGEFITQAAEYGIAAHKISRHLAKGAPKLRD